MRAYDLLKAVPFGQGIAENDKELENYFVKTPDFWEVVDDEVDLILGTKGSGKTAISSIVGSRKSLERTQITKLDNVMMVAAFSTGASTIFSRLNDSVSETVLRRIWMAYLLGIACNYILDQDSRAQTDVDALETMMGKAELRARNTTPPSQWDRLTADLIEPLRGGDLDDTDHDLPMWAKPQFDYLPLAQAASEILKSRGQRCWILLDRLDEAFSDRPELERTALRALLRTHLDLASLSECLRTKIFLRSDIFERVTHAQGFVNLDHFRVVTLKWNPSDISALLSERILASSATAYQELSGKPKAQVVNWCLPSPFTFFDGKRYVTRNTLNWCIEMSSSRKNEPSPRNLLKLLKEAQRQALTRLGSEEHEIGRPLLETEDLVHGLTVLSKSRLEDTIYAETNHLRPYVETFRHRSQRATRETLEARFSPVASDRPVDQVIRELESAGFLYPSQGDLFDVAPLYLSALDIEAGVPGLRATTLSVPTTAQQSTHEGVRSKAKELVARGAGIEAVNILVRQSAITIENARLAANVAIEFGDVSSMRRVDALLGNLDFSNDILGKRMALQFALDLTENAELLISSVSNERLERIDDIFRDFIGGLTFDAEVENRTWSHLLALHSVRDSSASVWDSWLPVMASSRFLAVARGLKGEESYDERTRELALEWFGEQRERAIPTDRLTDFLKSYLIGFDTTSVALFPYQVVSVVHVLDRLDTVSEQLRTELVREVARHVRVGAEKHRRSFRDWADLDAFAGDVWGLVEAQGR